ncbi:MAG: DUF5916 domain-containing protein, partial [Rhodothermales bacterium]
VIPRLGGEIRLDGVIDESAWEAIDPLDLVVQTPVFGNPPSERTEVRIAYDDTHLYAAGHMYGAPENVFAASFKRDLFTVATDYFGLVLDSYDDNENAVTFFTTPTGGRTDWVMFDDARPDINWNTYWDAAVTHTDEGWFAEMRIPFSSIRFQDEDGRVVMGLIAVRLIGKKNEWSTYPAIPPRWGFWSWAKPSQAQTISFDALRSTRPVYVTPYLLGGMSQEYLLNSSETAYQRVDDPAYDVGVDVKYGVTSNLTLDLTVNTDFAQVEADNQQVNLTRFSLFFPEKRPFFLERARIFDVNVGGADRIFYSRRIGLVDGNAIPIIGGARLVGRVGGWDVGLLDMQSARSGLSLPDGAGHPSENLGTLRLRRQVFNANSYAGGIATSRIDERGGYNLVLGLDGLFRIVGDEYASLTWAQSFDDGGSRSVNLESARLHAQWERRIVDGFSYRFGVTRSGPAFDPALGFLLRRDFTRIGDQISYSWFVDEDSPILRHQIWLQSSTFLRNANGTVETSEIGPKWEMRWKAGPEITTTLLRSYDDLQGAFRLAGQVEVPEGSYSFYDVHSRYYTGGGSMLRTGISARAGSYYDGRILGFDVDPGWTISRYLELSGFYAFNRITFPDRDQQLDVHLVRLNMAASLNVKLSATAFIQYSSAADALITNVRIRYNAREGNDLYVVYNEGRNTNRYGLEPRLPLTS